MGEFTKVKSPNIHTGCFSYLFCIFKLMITGKQLLQYLLALVHNRKRAMGMVASKNSATLNARHCLAVSSSQATMCDFHEFVQITAQTLRLHCTITFTQLLRCLNKILFNSMNIFTSRLFVLSHNDIQSTYKLVCSSENWNLLPSKEILAVVLEQWLAHNWHRE